MAAARPPPTRPHTAIHPPTFRSGDWGEDDVWDSGSDSESPGPQQPNSSGTWNRSPPSVSRHSSANTAPKPVPNRPSSNSSSSTLAFSYTHISAPSPSSYPPQATNIQSTKNGWTLIGKPGVAGGDSAEEKDESSGADVSPDQVDLEGELVVGDFDLESFPAPSNRMRHAQGLLREDAETIVDDPLHIIRRQPTRDDKSASPSPSRSASPTSQQNAEKLMRERSIKSNRRRKFVDCISCEDISIAELRKLAWSGAPAELRPIVWPLLLGYLPLPASLRSSTLTRRRSEYQSLVELTFARDRAGLDQQVWHQIEIDVPRTRPGVRLWMQETTQRSLERILYVWAIRHPASGYVQGINDLVTPFFQVFLSAYIDSDPEEFDTALLPHKVLQAIEADSFWCLSRLLDGIQDNYISQQPGIHRSVRRMAELVARIDAPLYAHLESENVEFMQFAFRWMNCLLMREISVQNTIRMWDTYLAEGTDAFSQFHLYVCSAFLVKWSKKLLQMDFQGIIMFLQSLPTQDWGDHDVEMLLSEAFLLNSIWHNAQSHFTGKVPS